MQVEIDRLEAQQTFYQNATEAAERNEEWCVELAKLVREVQAKSLVEFDVFVQIGNERRRILTAMAERNERTVE
jgi:hypothetical protein